MMLKVSDIPQDEIQQNDSDDVEFIIHHNYAGTRDFQSNMRVELHAGPYYGLLDSLVKDRLQKKKDKFTLTKYQKKCRFDIEDIFKVLLFQGFLMIV